MEWKEIAGNIPLALAALGLCATAIQVHRNRTSQRENTAKSIYRDYLQMAVNDPLLADGDFQKITTSNGLEKYRWFVSYLLWACEEIIEFAPKDEIWDRDVRQQIGYHRQYLLSSEFKENELGFYSEKLQDYIVGLEKA
jgi:hypothetical protein